MQRGGQGAVVDTLPKDVCAGSRTVATRAAAAPIQSEANMEIENNTSTVGMTHRKKSMVLFYVHGGYDLLPCGQVLPRGLVSIVTYSKIYI